MTTHYLLISEACTQIFKNPFHNCHEPYTIEEIIQRIHFCISRNDTINNNEHPKLSRVYLMLTVKQLHVHTEMERNQLFVRGYLLILSHYSIFLY